MLPWPYVLGHCHVGRPIHDPFSVLSLREGDWHPKFPRYIHPPLDTVKSSCPLNWETPPKHKVSTSMLHSGDGVLGVVLSISLPPNTSESSWCQIALFWSHLTTSPSPKPPPDHPGVPWQTSDGPVHVPSPAEEPCVRNRILILHGVVCYWWFSSWSQLPSRSLTSSSCVVLGWSLTFPLIIDIPRGEILHGAPDRGRLAVNLCFFHFLIIAPTVVNFFVACLFSCSPSQVYNFVPDVLRQRLCLAHGRNIRMWLIVWTGGFYTGVLGNELRLGVLLNGKLTGLWEPELLLVSRGSNTYLMQKYDIKCIKFIWCCYSGFFCDILLKC